MKKIILIAVLSISFSIAMSAQSVLSFDKYHSRLSFSANHLGISFVEGIFKIFDATLISTKEDFSDAQIQMNADVKSISTEVDMRDADLRDNWFETAKYPEMNFKSTSFRNVGGKNYKLTGDITIKGVSKRITFDVVYNGKALNGYSKKYSHGFTITGKLNRNDFGIGKETISTVGAFIGLKANVEFVIN
ncbi:MAG: YceI family protein [Mariniphaga sp.]